VTETPRAPETPQAGIAETLHDLSDQTRDLVRLEARAAVREMWDKARRSGPAVGLLAASGLLSLFATASAYRLSLRLLEKRLSPVAAALTATVGYGTAATYTALVGIRQLREAPAPVPVETAREASAAAAQAIVANRDSAPGPIRARGRRRAG
jgi:Putative Actinobacterial Holin-X, holin superfamily III